ncbi:MAG: hypothetical protein CSA26_09580 [Desulfobacterales bacterium]|nr:MAG: hypothetical protein CSA26_09580 [Desulfobacterales bacterium]
MPVIIPDIALTLFRPQGDSMIRIESLSIKLPGFSLDQVNLDIEAGEFFCLLGPTGAGKTLILESIAGIIGTSSGRIVVAGRDVTHLPPEQRGIGIVYQDCSLFPHLNAAKNIAYGLRYHHNRETNEPSRYRDLIERLGLSALLDRSVTTLSGGEKQRVALARALATAPSVLLLDEPLATLDPCFREEIRGIFHRLHQETGLTVMMVTHDFTDAHILADHVAILHDGRIEQTGSVETVFKQPATAFVAEFVGMKNILPARINGNHLHIGNLVFPAPDTSDEVQLAMIRPEHVLITPVVHHNKASAGLSGRIATISNQGVFAELVVEAIGMTFYSVMLSGALLEAELQPGRLVRLHIDPSNIHLM